MLSHTECACLIGGGPPAAVMLIVLAAGTIAGCAAAAGEPAWTASPARPLTGRAFDGGKVRFDGVFYDFRAANGIQMFKMWTPPNVEVVRGVLVYGNPGGNGDSRDTCRDARLQEFAARHGLGIMGVTSFYGRRIYPELGKVILEGMKDWAKLGVHRELAHLPLIPRGNSNGGATAYGLTCYAPERVICFTSNVGPFYNPKLPPDAALNVPALIHVGPKDRFRGPEETAAMFDTIRAKGARWSWDAEQDKGHEDGHVNDIDFKFLETCLALRLPAGADAREGPVKLRELPLESGWLVDFTSWESGITRIAPYGRYEGDKSKAGWVPSEGIAVLQRGLATYDNPVTIGLRGHPAINNPFGSGRYLKDATGQALEAGLEITLEGRVEGFDGWRRMEFYHGAEKIGQAKRGREAATTFTVDKRHTVYAFTAVAYDDEGVARTAFPLHFLVRDPAVSKALAAQREAHDRTAAMPRRPAYGSGAKAGAARADAGAAVLVACGLSEAMEKGFDGATGPAPFWQAVGARHDPVRLTVKDHLGSRGDRETAAGPRDVDVRIKAAHSRAGLYLWFAVTDDVRARPADLNDTLDFHIARSSSKAIWQARPADVFVKLESWALVLDEAQYQIHLGTAKQRPATLFRNVPDPWDVRRLAHGFDEARRRFGIVVRHHEPSADRRIVELFLPWRWVGTGGSDAEPAVGTRLAVTLGYNDFDPGEHKGSDDMTRLRWPNRIDPWWRAGEKGPAPSAWGDLEIGPRLAE